MEASVRRFWLLNKAINRGNGTECLLRCCSAARILHSERPAFVCDCRSYGWVAQLAEQWTENPRVGGSIPPPATIALRAEEQPKPTVRTPDARFCCKGWIGL